MLTIVPVKNPHELLCYSKPKSAKSTVMTKIQTGSSLWETVQIRVKTNFAPICTHVWQNSGFFFWMYEVSPRKRPTVSEGLMGVYQRDNCQHKLRLRTWHVNINPLSHHSSQHRPREGTVCLHVPLPGKNCLHVPLPGAHIWPRSYLSNEISQKSDLNFSRAF